MTKCGKCNQFETCQCVHCTVYTYVIFLHYFTIQTAPATSKQQSWERINKRFSIYRMLLTGRAENTPNKILATGHTAGPCLASRQLYTYINSTHTEDKNLFLSPSISLYYLPPSGAIKKESREPWSGFRVRWLSQSCFTRQILDTEKR